MPVLTETISIEEGKAWMEKLMNAYKTYYEKCPDELGLVELKTSNANNKFFAKIEDDTGHGSATPLFDITPSITGSWLRRLEDGESREFSVQHRQALQKLIRCYNDPKNQGYPSKNTPANDLDGIRDYELYILGRFQIIRLNEYYELDINDSASLKIDCLDDAFFKKSRNPHNKQFIRDALMTHNDERLFTLEELVGIDRNIFIASDGGSGKSTVLIKTLYSLAKNGLTPHQVPILILLKHRSSLNLLEEIRKEFDRFKIEFDETKKRVVLFLDGLDEFRGDIGDLLAEILELNELCVINTIVTGRKQPVVFDNKNFLPFHLTNLLESDVKHLFTVCIDNKQGEGIFDHLRSHPRFGYLYNPLFNAYLITYINQEIRNSRRVELRNLDDLLRNRGLLMKSILVDSYLKKYEHKHSRIKTISEDEWKSLKEHEIRLVSLVAHLVLSRGAGNGEKLSKIKSTLMMNKLFSADEDLVELNIDETIEKFKNHSILESVNSKIGFVRDEYASFFAIYFLSFSVHDIQSLRKAVLRVEIKKDDSHIDSVKFLYGLAPKNIIDWNVFFQLNTKVEVCHGSLFTDLLDAIILMDQGNISSIQDRKKIRTYLKELIVNQIKLQSNDAVLNSKIVSPEVVKSKTDVINTLIDILLSYPIDFSGRELLDIAISLPPFYSVRKQKIVTTIFREPWRGYKLSDHLLGELICFRLFNLPSNYSVLFNSSESFEVLDGYCMIQKILKPSVITDYLYSHSRFSSFTELQHNEVLNFIHDLMKIHRRVNTSKTVFFDKKTDKLIANSILYCWMRFWEKVEIGNDKISELVGLLFWQDLCPNLTGEILENIAGLLNNREVSRDMKIKTYQLLTFIGCKTDYFYEIDQALSLNLPVDNACIERMVVSLEQNFNAGYYTLGKSECLTRLEALLADERLDKTVRNFLLQRMDRINVAMN